MGLHQAVKSRAQANLIKVKRFANKLGFKGIGSTYGSKELDDNPELVKLYEQELAKLSADGWGKKRRRRAKK